MKQQFDHAAFAGIDKDTDVRGMNTKDGFHPDARNIHMEPLKAPSSQDGTVQLDPSLPAGINTPVGSYWDRREDTRIDLWHNSIGEHSIIRHYVKDSRFETLVRSAALNFSTSHLVTGFGLVDDQYFYWTDDINPPRMIDLHRAGDRTIRKPEIRLYIPSHIDAQSRSFVARVRNPSGVIVFTVPVLYTATAQDVSEYTPMLKGLEMAWNANGTLNNYFTAHACNDYMEFEGLQDGDWSVLIDYIDTVNSVVIPPASAVWEYRDRYNNPWHREQMDMGAFVPYAPPLADIGNDPTDTVNSVDRRVLRFAYSYIFRDRGYSPMSPWSLPAFSVQTCLTTAIANQITIDLSDDTNLDLDYCRGEVDFIEVYFQEGTENGWMRDWRSAGRFPKEDWIYTREIEFDNNTIPVAVDIAYSDLFSFSTPHVAKAACQIVDQDSNNRLLLGNTVEGHDTPCLNVDLDLEIAESATLANYVDLEVWVRVCNMFAYPTVSSAVPVLIANANNYYRSQPIWVLNPGGPNRIGGMGNQGQDSSDCDQTTATGGFPVYIAGQQYVAVTEQVVTYRTNTQTQFLPNTTVLDGTNLGSSFNIANRSGREGIRSCIEQGDIYQRAVIRGVQTGQTVVIRVASPKCDFLDDGSILDLNSPDLLYQKTSTNIFGLRIPNTTYIQYPEIERREMIVTIPTNASGTIFLGEFLYADNTVPEDLAAKSCPVDFYLFDDDGDDYSNPGNDIRQTGYPMTRTYVGAVTYESVTNTPYPITLANWFPIGFVQYSFANNRCRGADFWASLGYSSLDKIYREFRNVTDHNGFTWIPIRKWQYGPPAVPLPFQWRAAVVSVSGDPSLAPGIVDGIATNTNYTLTQIDVTDLTVVNDLGDNKWVGGLEDAVLAGPDVFLDTIGNRNVHYVAGNVNPGSRDWISTKLEGTIQDTNGFPVNNLSVICTWGGWTKSSNGIYQIVLHGSMNNSFSIGSNNNDRVEDRPIFNWTGVCLASIVGGSTGSLINIYQYWSGRTYSFNVPYLYPLVQLAQAVENVGPFFKRWGVYDVGIIGVDQHGNPTPVQHLKRFNIPGINDDLYVYDPVKYPLPTTFLRGAATINWSVNTDVPIPEYNRFRYFQFVVTPEQSTDRYLTWAVSNVLYVSRWDNSAAEPVVSGYGANAREIYLNFGDSFERFRELNAASAIYQTTPASLDQFGQVGWAFQAGDRIRIITNWTGAYQPTAIDVEVTGQRGDYLVIRNSTTIPEMKGGEIVQLYRPGKEAGESKYYQEIPGARVVIDDPFGTPAWINPTGTTANSDALMGADAWNIASQIPVRPGWINDTDTPNVPWQFRIWNRESMSVTDFWPSKVDALGRVAIEDPQAEQRRRGTIIRVSNGYLPGTSRNGLRLFEPLNNKVANTDYGLIQYLEEIDQVVVAPCTANRTFAIYLSRTLVTTGDSELITIGGAILGTMRAMAWRFGTQHPESIVRGDTFMFWVDAQAGAVVRYDTNGVKSISQRGIGNWFSNYCREYVQFPGGRFFGGFNSEFREYVVTLKVVQKIFNGIDIESGGITLAYWYANSEEAANGNRWIGFKDEIPQYYGRSSGRMFSMFNGSVWLHDADASNQNVIYGIKRPMSVDMLFNNDPVVKKIFLAVQANNGGGWYSPSITTPEGQVSNLVETDYVLDEGVSKAAVLRDVNSPVPNPISYGDPMRSAALTVRFSNDCNDGKVVLNSAGIHYRTSPET